MESLFFFVFVVGFMLGKRGLLEGGWKFCLCGDLEGYCGFGEGGDRGLLFLSFWKWRVLFLRGGFFEVDVGCGGECFWGMRRMGWVEERVGGWGL